MVHITVNYEDASVIVVHGEVEIGQGINTKLCHVCRLSFFLTVNIAPIQIFGPLLAFYPS